MIFALSAVAVIGCGGVGVDLARAMVAKNRMADALDAAALAVGTTQGLTNAQMRDMAQKYFDANYNAIGFGTPGPVQLATSGVNGANISLTVNSNVPTSILPIIGIDNVPVAVSNQVTRALTKLRVALVLDNTGSMTQTDATGTSKISALISATHSLLTILQNAASSPGDVQVSLVPFSKTVNVGTGNASQAWLDWTDWEAAPANAGTIANTVGPGSACPWTTSAKGYQCQNGSTNAASTVTTIPVSGANAGFICPSVDNGSFNSGRLGRYYNGCYNSVVTHTTASTNGSATNTQVCSKTNQPSGTCTTSHYCTGKGYPITGTKTTNASNVNVHTYTITGTACTCTTGSSATCTRTDQPEKDTDDQWSHTWAFNNHNTWAGCVMDRAQNYDEGVSNPSSSANKFPTENAQSCVPSVMKGTLGYDWTTLNNAVTAMTAGGSTNQTIGFVWGWQSLTQGSPLNAPAIDPDTTNVIILLSDGMNTQDRWYGDGSTTNTTIDGRLTTACAAAKAQGVQIYTVLVMAGNSTPLQACATDSSKYFALTTAGAIITTFNQIGQTLANLHLSR